MLEFHGESEERAQFGEGSQLHQKVRVGGRSAKPGVPLDPNDSRASTQNRWSARVA